MIVDQQLLRGVATNLQATLSDSDGDPVAGLTVTVGVVKADGTEVIAAGTAATDAGGGIYTVAVTAAQAASLDWLTATWKVAGVTRAVTVHEIVGGFYWSVAAALALEPTLAAVDPAELRQVRRDVEAEFEAICGVAFVPRYVRRRVDGSGRCAIVVPETLPRLVRSVRVYTDATTYTAWTADEVAAVQPEPSGRLVRVDGGVWPAGLQNIVVEFEHGYDACPPDVKRASIRRAKSRQHMSKSAVPANAMSFTTDGGATFRLSTPAADRTGDLEVDAVLARYSLRFGIA